MIVGYISMLKLTKQEEGGLSCAAYPSNNAGRLYRLFCVARVLPARRGISPFKLEWLLRNVNTIVTGKALFSALKDVDTPTFQKGNELPRPKGRGIQVLSYISHQTMIFADYIFLYIFCHVL